MLYGFVDMFCFGVIWCWIFVDEVGDVGGGGVMEIIVCGGVCGIVVVVGKCVVCLDCGVGFVEVVVVEELFFLCEMMCEEWLYFLGEVFVVGGD